MTSEQPEVTAPPVTVGAVPVRPSIFGPIRRFAMLASTLVGAILLSCWLATSISFSAQRPIPQNAPTTEPIPVTMSTYQVGGTGGAGVYIRRTPRLVDQIRAWTDGTVMEQVGDDVDAEGIRWHMVRDPDGNLGYVPASYLLEVSTGNR